MMKHIREYYALNSKHSLIILKATSFFLFYPQAKVII